MLKKNLKKIIFFSFLLLFFILFSLSNRHEVLLEIFGNKQTFKVWSLVLYSAILGSILTVLFLLPSMIMLKSRHKRLIEKFEILSDAKLKEAIKDEDIIE